MAYATTSTSTWSSAIGSSAAPKTNHTTSARISPPSSVSSPACSRSAASGFKVAPNEIPATNAAMNPLPPTVSAASNAPSPMASVAMRLPPWPIHPRRAVTVISTAPPMPSTAPATMPSPSSPKRRAGFGRRAVGDEAELTRGDRQHERHDRGGDAVVEPALHVEPSSEPRRDARVVDDLHAERSVGRSERGPRRTRRVPMGRSRTSGPASTPPSAIDSGRPMPSSRTGIDRS